MATKHNHECEECTSDASCHDTGFAERVSAYESNFLNPTLRRMGGASMLPQRVRDYTDSFYGV
jgi:hypothetical protein